MEQSWIKQSEVQQSQTKQDQTGKNRIEQGQAGKSRIEQGQAGINRTNRNQTKQTIEYRRLQENEICRELFGSFKRRQVVKDCWRRDSQGNWCIKEDPFIDDWSETDYDFLVKCLKNTVRTGGYVCAGFIQGRLKGFVSVESELFGGDNRYLDLSSIHVSEDMRGQGMGKTLFLAAKKWAGEHGAAKLYISAHSAVESQSFYRAMGCVEAAEYNRRHVEEEPYDCQLECLC